MHNRKQGFSPVADEQARILILGSMPSEASLQQVEYYAHPRNAFWRIMAALFGYEAGATYAQRTALLKQHRLALWDVVQACERQGSLDSAIDDGTIVANDFASFYTAHPHIRQVFFNGAKAEKEYLRRVLPGLPAAAQAIARARLPSTSPAMAQLSFEQKLQAWSIITQRL